MYAGRIPLLEPHFITTAAVYGGKKVTAQVMVAPSSGELQVL
jgi:hypothetical protein